jgi:predicted PhzF superfamily epimerase YddE/YHI9
MIRFTFNIIDVFAEKPLAGCQLAVVRDGVSLRAVMMPAIVRDLPATETLAAVKIAH